MSIRQCPNHHFYDSNKYAVCPVCLMGQDTADASLDQTVGYAAVVDPLSDKTVSYQFAEREDFSKPVVGWLVGINGKILGRDWRLHEGRNDIGTDADSEVLLEIQTNTRQRFGSVIYDAKHQCFLLMPGNTSLLYLNGKLLTNTMPLVDGDKIGVEGHLLCFQKFQGKYCEPLG